MADSQLQLKLRNELITAEFKSFSYKFKPRTNGEDKIDYLPTVQGFVGNLGSLHLLAVTLTQTTKPKCYWEPCRPFMEVWMDHLIHP